MGLDCGRGFGWGYGMWLWLWLWLCLWLWLWQVVVAEAGGGWRGSLLLLWLVVEALGGCCVCGFACGCAWFLTFVCCVCCSSGTFIFLALAI